MHFLHPIAQNTIAPQYLSVPLVDPCGTPVSNIAQYCVNTPEGLAYFYQTPNDPISGFYSGTFQDTSSSYWFNITNGVLQSYTPPTQLSTPYEGYFYDSTTLSAVYVYATQSFTSNPAGLIGSGILVATIAAPYASASGSVCGGLNGIYLLDLIYGPTYTFVNGSPAG